MGSTTEFMVAIELGSTRITGIAGQKNADGSLGILAYADEDARACIRKGVIFNIDKTAGAITSIINKLEAALDAGISRVYVGINGQSLRTIKSTVGKNLDNDTRITLDIVDDLIRTDRNADIDSGLEILEVIPQEYKVGSGMQIDPIGVVSNHIEGRFLNIVAQASMKRQIERCFELAKTRIAGFFISPIEMSKAVLTEAELRSGCALIDFGAETTTVMVFKDHLLRHLVVLPLGGNNINKDICSLKIEECDAEELKIKYGKAYTEPSEFTNKESRTYTFGVDNNNISENQLCEIIEARQEEIISNMWYQIKLSGYDDKLMSGIIITGGASAMNGLQTAIAKKTGIEKIRVASYINVPVESVTAELLSHNGRHCTLLGMLASSELNCCEQEPIAPLFNDEGEASVTDVQQERQAKEEEIRKLQEEAALTAAKEQEAQAALLREAELKKQRELEEELAAQQRAKLEAEKEEKRKNSLQNRLSRWGKKLIDDLINGED